MTGIKILDDRIRKILKVTDDDVYHIRISSDKIVVVTFKDTSGEIKISNIFFKNDKKRESIYVSDKGLFFIRDKVNKEYVDVIVSSTFTNIDDNISGFSIINDKEVSYLDSHVEIDYTYNNFLLIDEL